MCACEHAELLTETERERQRRGEGERGECVAQNQHAYVGISVVVREQRFDARQVASAHGVQQPLLLVARRCAIVANHWRRRALYTRRTDP
jgi:hypothetical protein